MRHKGAFEIHFASDEGTWRSPPPVLFCSDHQLAQFLLGPGKGDHAEEIYKAAGRFKEVFYPPPALEPPGSGRVTPIAPDLP